MPESQMVLVVAGCLLKKDGKYLLVQEKHKEVYGKWNLPAGRVDVGESLEVAAAREVQEETGYEVKVGDKISIEHIASDKPVLHAYHGEITGGELTHMPDEALDAKWFTLKEIEALHNQGQIRVDWAWRVIQQANKEK